MNFKAHFNILTAGQLSSEPKTNGCCEEHDFVRLRGVAKSAEKLYSSAVPHSHQVTAAGD